MASIMYDDIFSSFLGNVTDYEFASKDISEAYDDMKEYLHKTVTKMYIRRQFSTINFEDDTQIFTYEIKYPIDEITDNEFVINLLGKGMVYEWIAPKVQTTTAINQMFSGGDKKWFAQANHLNSNRSLRDDIEREVRRMINDREISYNDYIGNVNGI